MQLCAPASSDASGVMKKTPQGVQTGDCACTPSSAGTATRAKGLEPSRRLSETTGPRSPGAFRVVFPAPEVTERGARCKRAWRFLTHRAPGGEAAIR